MLSRSKTFFSKLLNIESLSLFFIDCSILFFKSLVVFFILLFKDIPAIIIDVIIDKIDIPQGINHFCFFKHFKLFLYVPKDNPATNEISNLYKRSTIHLLLYGFISGVQWCLPNASKTEAAKAFLKRYNLEGSYSIEDVLTTYNRINKDVINVERIETKGKSRV